VRTTFLVVNYWPSVGGAQSHVRRVAEGLAHRHGHDVEVITTDALHSPAGRQPGKVPVGEQTVDGVHVVRLPVARRAHTVVRNVRRARRVAGVPGASRPTILSGGPLGARLALAVRRAALASDAVVGVANPFLTLAGADWGTRGTTAAHIAMPLLHLSAGPPAPWALATLRRADGCTASTEMEREWLVDHGVDAGRIALLPPGCEPDRYRDVDAATARAGLGIPERPTVGYVGRMAAHKGVDTLLESMERLWSTHPDTNVLLAGSGAGWADFEQVVASFAPAAGERLVRFGEFGDDEKPLLLSACDVVAFPSREESFGMVSLESWAARRPVVAADIAAVRCVVRPGVDGELIEVGDAAGLADAVATLLDDPERRAAYGAAGRRRVEAEFTWDGIVDRWAEFLDESVERHRRHRAGSGA